MQHLCNFIFSFIVFIAFSCADCFSVMHFSIASVAVCLCVYVLCISHKFIKKVCKEKRNWIGICCQCHWTQWTQLLLGNAGQQCHGKTVRWKSINWSWISLHEIESAEVGVVKWQRQCRLLARFLMEHVHMELMDASSAPNNDFIHVLGTGTYCCPFCLPSGHTLGSSHLKHY